MHSFRGPHGCSLPELSTLKYTCWLDGQTVEVPRSRALAQWKQLKSWEASGLRDTSQDSLPVGCMRPCQLHHQQAKTHPHSNAFNSSLLTGWPPNSSNQRVSHGLTPALLDSQPYLPRTLSRQRQADRSAALCSVRPGLRAAAALALLSVRRWVWNGIIFTFYKWCGSQIALQTHCSLSCFTPLPRLCGLFRVSMTTSDSFYGVTLYLDLFASEWGSNSTLSKKSEKIHSLRFHNNMLGKVQAYYLLPSLTHSYIETP